MSSKSKKPSDGKPKKSKKSSPKHTIVKSLLSEPVEYVQADGIVEDAALLSFYHPLMKTDTKKSTTWVERVPIICWYDGNEIKIKEIQTPEESPAWNLLQINGSKYLLRDRPVDCWLPLDFNAGNLDVTSLLEENLSIPSTIEILHNYLHDFTDFDRTENHAAKVITLWIVGTYIFSAYPAYPYLWVHGEKGSGKTELLTSLSLTSFYGLLASKITPAALYRLLATHGATLCIDEAETLRYHKDDSTDKILVLNAGYKDGSYAYLVNRSTDMPERFPVYSPKALASISSIEPTLQSRSIRFIMRRSTEFRATPRNAEMERKIRSVLCLMRLRDGTGLRDEIRSDYIHSKHGLCGRDYEMFRPIIHLCERYMPAWIDDIKNFITMQISNRDQEDGPEMIISTTLMKMWDREGRRESNGTWGVYVSDIRVELETLGIEMDGRKIGQILTRLGHTKVIRVGPKRFRKRTIILDILKEFIDGIQEGDERDDEDGQTQLV